MCIVCCRLCVALIRQFGFILHTPPNIVVSIVAAIVVSFLFPTLSPCESHPLTMPMYLFFIHIHRMKYNEAATALLQLTLLPSYSLSPFTCKKKEKKIANTQHES